MARTVSRLTLPDWVPNTCLLESADGHWSISAGFDGHRRDPLAELQLDAADFGWLSEALVALADRHCQGRVVSALEGGYDLDALAESSVVHLRALGA